MVLTAFSKSFSNEKFKGNEPSSQPILRIPTLDFTSIITIFATNVYGISTRYQPCAKCLEYVCEQNGQSMISSCSRHGARMNKDCDKTAGGCVGR